MKRLYVFFGLPGSGKGTQVDLFKKYLDTKNENYLHLEMGKTLREQFSKQDTKLVKDIKAAMNSGELVPSSVPAWALFETILNNYNDEDIIILDGGFRKEVEAILGLELLSFLGFKDNHLFLIDVPEEEVFKRLKLRVREDDTDESIAKRIGLYNEDQKKSLEYMKKHLTVHPINGVGKEEDINELIKKEYDN